MVTIGDKIIVGFGREQVLQLSHTQIFLWRWVDFLFFPFKVYIFKKSENWYHPPIFVPSLSTTAQLILFVWKNVDNVSHAVTWHGLPLYILEFDVSVINVFCKTVFFQFGVFSCFINNLNFHPVIGTVYKNGINDIFKETASCWISLVNQRVLLSHHTMLITLRRYIYGRACTFQYY